MRLNVVIKRTGSRRLDTETLGFETLWWASWACRAGDGNGSRDVASPHNTLRTLTLLRGVPAGVSAGARKKTRGREFRYRGVQVV